MNVNDFPKIFDNTKKVIIYNKGKIIPGMTNFGYSEITICVFLILFYNIHGVGMKTFPIPFISAIPQVQ